MGEYLIWDFDGTLGYREGGAWTASLLEVLDREMPGHGVTFEALRDHLRPEFPWHTWETPHLHLATADEWWDALYPVLEGGYLGVGIDAERAVAFVREFRNVYLGLDRWRLYDDVLPTLDTLSSLGWTHVILSNHVPELGDIVRHLGLDSRIDRVFNSAEIGYEKPHPRAFEMVLETLPDVEVVWMIGDSFHADVEGAEGMGIPAIQVRRPRPEARYGCEALTDILRIIETTRRVVSTGQNHLKAQLLAPVQDAKADGHS